MHIDASALIAILTSEAEAPALLARLRNDPLRKTTPLAVWETTLAVSRLLGLELPRVERAVEEFLDLMDIMVMDVPAAARAGAVRAFDLFGQSRHPAALNFGDCFAYACARLDGEPLLYAGDRFPHTDIRTA